MTNERRARGTGRIFKPKKCRFWYIRYNDADGKKRSESTRSEKRADAEKLLRDRLGRKDVGRLRELQDVRNVKFEDLRKLIENDYQAKKKKSTARLNTALSHLKVSFGSYRAVDITEAKLVHYVAKRQAEKAADSSIQKELACLKRMFRLAIKRKMLRDCPDFSDLITVENTRTGFFELDEFRRLLNELPAHHQAWATFCYYTGWRARSEVLTLTWDQVDFDAGVIRLDPGTTKNKEGRTFPFNVLPQLEELLKKQYDLRRIGDRICPLVFHRNGEYIKSYYGAWNTACKRAGVAGMIVHDFRRTAVRNLERAGVSRSVAMKLVGHKTESIYRRYAITNEQDLREGLGKLTTLHEKDQEDVTPIARSG